MMDLNLRKPQLNMPSHCRQGQAWVLATPFERAVPEPPDFVSKDGKNCRVIGNSVDLMDNNFHY